MQLVSGTYARRETGRSVDIHTRPRSLTHTLVNLISFVLLASSCPLSHTPILIPLLSLSLSLSLSPSLILSHLPLSFPLSLSLSRLSLILALLYSLSLSPSASL